MGCTLHIGNYVGVASESVQTFISANWTREVLNSAWQVTDEETRDIIHQFQKHPTEKLVVNHDFLKESMRHRRALESASYFSMSFFETYNFIRVTGFYAYVLTLFFRAFCSHYCGRITMTFVFFAKRPGTEAQPVPTEDQQEMIQLKE